MKIEEFYKDFRRGEFWTAVKRKLKKRGECRI